MIFRLADGDVLIEDEIAETKNEVHFARFMALKKFENYCQSEYQRRQQKNKR